jgi:isopentenyl phosphate kinase
MPRKGHVFSEKEHRQVEHIKESELRRGHSEAEAEGIGYATVVKHGGSKHHYTAKEKRQAEHIAESEEARGASPAEAKNIGYATVNARKKKKA